LVATGSLLHQAHRFAFIGSLGHGRGDDHGGNYNPLTEYKLALGTGVRADAAINLSAKTIWQAASVDTDRFWNGQDWDRTRSLQANPQGCLIFWAFSIRKR
jgi:hypothetical protein